MRKGILLSACLVGCICLGLITAISSNNLPPSLVVISIDGLKPDYVSSVLRNRENKKKKEKKDMEVGRIGNEKEEKKKKKVNKR